VFAAQPPTCTSLGILGGTFNPPHLGHLALARATIDELGCERVLLVPALLAPHKPSAHDPGAQHRLSMCRLMARCEPRIEVSTIELDRRGPSYTVDTLRSIHATNPDAELTLILGADIAQTLPEWREPREILGLCRLASAERDSFEHDAVERAVRGIDPHTHVEVLRMAPLHTSSSAVRDRVAAGEPVKELVGPAVACYIDKHGLYR
jgi:nicotinate-nucleotide adenylyltransferase